MFSRTDKKSMIIQALAVSPELMDVVLEGLDDFSEANDVSKDLVRECVEKVIEIKSLRSKAQPPPIPQDTDEWEERTPTVFDRVLNKLKRD